MAHVSANTFIFKFSKVTYYFLMYVRIYGALLPGRLNLDDTIRENTWRNFISYNIFFKRFH